jgi:hypothetical protein
MSANPETVRRRPPSTSASASVNLNDSGGYDDSSGRRWKRPAVRTTVPHQTDVTNQASSSIRASNLPSRTAFVKVS